MQPFTIGSSLIYGWETFKKRPWTFIGATTIATLLPSIVNWLTKAMVGDSFGASLVTFVPLLLFSVLIDKGLYTFTLKAHDKAEEVSLYDLWQPQSYWRYLNATVLVMLILCLGFIALIIPAIIFYFVFFFYKFVAIDTNLGPEEILKETARITKGHRWHLFGFFLATIGVAVVGLLCLVVGFLVAAPVMTIAMAHAYRTLKSQAEAVVPVSTIV